MASDEAIRLVMLSPMAAIIFHPGWFLAVLTASVAGAFGTSRFVSPGWRRGLVIMSVAIIGSWLGNIAIVLLLGLNFP